MTRFFHAEEIRRPEDVIPHLAERERHWKKGRSAYELATSWIRSGEIPASVRAVLDTCPDYRGAELIQGLFEREVDLGTPGRRSQTDLMALVRLNHGYAMVAIEGKVEEPFGPPVSDQVARGASQRSAPRLGSIRPAPGRFATSCSTARPRPCTRLADMVAIVP